jgi:hypothetical protein
MESLYWDYLILSYLTACFLSTYIAVTYYKRHSKRLKSVKKILLISIGAFFIFALGVLFYGSYIEPKLIKIIETKIDLGKTVETENIKIVQLSDLHAGPYKKTAYFKKVANKINDLKPDLIIFTGDYIFNNEKDGRYLTAFADLAKNYPIYAVTGNHEFGQGSPTDKIKDKSATVKKVFDEIGINLIDNKNQEIEVKGKKIMLAGLQDIWSQPNKVESVLSDLTKNIENTEPKILLAHNPDAILIPESQKFDIILSGHTHAGQIRLPLIGEIVVLPTSLGRNYDYGLIKTGDNRWLNITAGIGEAGPRARLLNRPEIVLITLDL